MLKIAIPTDEEIAPHKIYELLRKYNFDCVLCGDFVSLKKSEDRRKIEESCFWKEEMYGFEEDEILEFTAFCFLDLLPEIGVEHRCIEVDSRTLLPTFFASSN